MQHPVVLLFLFNVPGCLVQLKSLLLLLVIRGSHCTRIEWDIRSEAGQ